MIRVGPRDGECAYVELISRPGFTLGGKMLTAGEMRQAAADLLERADEIELHKRKRKRP